MIRPPVTQAMIDAYDTYTHVTLDRRDLIARLTRLAGSAAAACAVLPLIEASPAQAAITAEDDPRVTTRTVGWPGARPGETMRGYLAWPAKSRKALPVVLVIHENRGLNAHIRDVTRRMALEGFVAVAPDFLSPVGGTPADENKARESVGKLDRERTIADARATIVHVPVSKGIPATTGKVGAIGFCWGGGLVNHMAAQGLPLAAGVSYYGMTPDPAAAARIRTPMLLHFAGLDERINAGMPAYRTALEASGTPHEIYVYPGANHAFNNDTSAARYDQDAADLAWKRTIAFLKKELRR